MIVPMPLGWLSPSRRSWPLVGLALALTACPGTPEPGADGPPGPQGDPGIGGTEGPGGDTGFATLIDAVAVERGTSECPYGGTRYDVGLDNGDGGGTARDGVLQSGEIDDSSTICAAPGALSAFEIPSGAVGTATIDARGGSGRISGGSGGEFGVAAGRTGGHAQMYATGSVDASFTTPAFDGIFLGSDPLVVATGVTLVPKIIVPGTEATALVEGDVFTYHDTSVAYEAQDFFFRRGTSNVRVTGIHVQAGAILEIPRDNYQYQSFLSVPYDIHNAGTIRAQLNGTQRHRLLMIAHHYYGEAGSLIDLTGVAGTSTTSGGEGGALGLVLATDRFEASYSYSQNGNSFSYCTTWSEDGDLSGGFYNHGAIDATPGALGSLESGGRSGPYVNVCASDEVYNTGPITSRAVGSAQGGVVALTGAEGGVNHSGAVDVRGASFGVSGGQGGVFRVTGAGARLSGSTLASGGDIATSVACTSSVTPCTGGYGGEVRVQTFGGEALVVGTADVRGGNATGSGGTFGSGGYGGELAVSAYDGSDQTLGAAVPAGEVMVGATVDARGGAGAASGGGGGSVVAIQYGQGTPLGYGQGAGFYGYASVDLTGGAAHEAGDGGRMLLFGGSGVPMAGRGPGIPIGAGGGGAAINTIPVVLSGGAGVDGGQGFSYGGEGGVVYMAAPASFDTPTAQVVNRAPLDLGGGSGTYGGYGGEALMYGSGLVEATGALDLAGSPGSATDATNGYGGGGGSATLMSQHGKVGVFGAINLDGAAAYRGGAGGTLDVRAREADVTAAVTAHGGAGQVLAGGDGGAIDVWSTQTFTVVSGTLGADAGTGTPAGADGWILVDGFVEQAP